VAVKLRNRIVGVYLGWAITALATTLPWVTVTGASADGHVRGLNGGMVMILSLASAAIVLWWDRGGRFDAGRIQIVTIAGGLNVAVIVRNLYNIGVRDSSAGFTIGFGLWIALIGASVATLLTLSLRRR
jgi:hypothetical protein